MAQVKFGANFALDVGIGPGEDAEQFFALLYKHAASTKHQSNVG